MIQDPPDMNLQDFLKADMLVPKKLLHEMRMSKKVTVNDDHPLWTKPLQSGDRITLPIFPERVEPQATAMPVDVLAEDEHLLIVNKKAGVDTHPSSETDHLSLSNGVAYYFQQTNIQAKVRHTHRLDKDTSGCILFAKHAMSGAILDKLLAERKIKRTYLALVEGIMKTKQGTIEKSIGKDRHHAQRRRISPSGQRAVTHFKVIKEFSSENLTLVELHLDTGRTHQIRVHLSSIGHPLFGDTLYGAKNKYHRHSLHAWKLAVPHPFNDSTITAEAPLPKDFGPAKLSLT